MFLSSDCSLGLAKRLLLAGFAVTTLSFPIVSSADDHLVKNRFIKMQSQDVELPEDFMVRVDGNKLQVSLVSLGAIDAQMSTSSMLVRLLNARGEEQEATTNAQGIAEFRDVQPDELHALLVADEKAHAAIPVMPLSAKNASMRGVNAKDFRLPVMPANKQEIMSAIVRGTTPSSNQTGVLSEQDSELYAVSDYKLRAINPYSVRLQKDGRLLGKVVVADRDLEDKLRFAKLTFLQNNQVIARTDSNPVDGSFDIASMQPGMYGLIASGPAGYSSFSFEVLPSTISPLIGNGALGRPVSIGQTETNEKLYVFLCPPKFVPKINEYCREAYGKPSDAAGATAGSGIPGSGAGLASSGMAGAGGFGGGGFGGGGFGGGGFGGGGFGGGAGGGLGGLLGVGGLIAVGAIVASNDNNNTTTTSPITP